MKAIRIELARDQQTAATMAEKMAVEGFTVTGPEACEIAWVSDASDPEKDKLPLKTYSPHDGQVVVFVVVGRI